MNVSFWGGVYIEELKLMEQKRTGPYFPMFFS